MFKNLRCKRLKLKNFCTRAEYLDLALISWNALLLIIKQKPVNSHGHYQGKTYSCMCDPANTAQKSHRRIFPAAVLATKSTSFCPLHLTPCHSPENACVLISTELSGKIPLFHCPSGPGAFTTDAQFLLISNQLWHGFKEMCFSVWMHPTAQQNHAGTAEIAEQSCPWTTNSMDISERGFQRPVGFVTRMQSPD